MEIKLQEQQAAPLKNDPGTMDIRREAAELELKGRIEADGRFLEEVNQNSEDSGSRKTEEDSGSDSTESETKTGRDTAALSDESKYYGLTEEELADLDKMWGKEAAEAAWKELSGWNPSAPLSLPELLSDLEAVYKELLSAILLNTTGLVKDQQLTLLDQLLSELLIKVLNSRMGELNSLFESFGSSGSKAALKAALYRGATGVFLTPKDLKEVFSGKNAMGRSGKAADTADFRGGLRSGDFGGGSSRKSGAVPKTADSGLGTGQSGSAAVVGKGEDSDSPTGNIRVPVNDGEGSLEQGVIYQKAGKGQIKSNQQYAKRMQAESGISVYGKQRGKGAGSGEVKALSRENSPSYSVKDLEAAERFAKYMNHEGNLFKIPGITAKNEELYGFLAALMAIKSQTLAGLLETRGRLPSDLREAVDRMIDYYMQKAFEQSRPSGNQYSRPAFEQKAAYKTYYYIMNIYQTTRNLQETVNKGIRQAYRQYLKKKECSKEDTLESFFTKEKKDAVADWKEGKRLLERDWKDFLVFLGREDTGNMPLEVMELSPWGMFLEPERQSAKKGGSSPFFLLGTMVLVAVLLLFLLFF